MLTSANTTRFLFDCPSAKVELRVVGFKAEQGLSDAYWCELELACAQSDLDITTLINKAGVLTLFDEKHPGFIHGEIAAASLGAVGRRFTTVHVTLRPKLWQLEFRSGLRIFQDQSVPDIVKQVLKEAGISGKDVRFEQTGSYPTRTYCTQYRESDFAFINRLLAEEGLTYFFDHSIERHTLVISDNKTSFKPIAGNKTLPYTPAAGMVTSEESITDFQVQHQLHTGAVARRDYFFEKPTLQLEQRDTAGRFAMLEHYDYPGHFSDNAAGKRHAQTRHQAEQAATHIISGRTDSSRLASGHTFTLSKHPRKDFNADYTLIRVRLQGRQPQSLEEGASSEGSSFTLDFHAIPASTDYRPLMQHPQPRIDGVQTAFVTGPKGEEIYTDAFGRIKVQFHWDREGKRDEKSSCWLRVSHAWAGNQWGSLTLPRIGQEVLVTFLDGNPDRPIVTGTLYNATSKTPYDLPANKTRTSFKSQSTPGGGGFNELRIEDKKGSEQLFLHAEKDANLYVKNDWKETLDHDTHLIVQKNAFETVEKDRHLKVEANRNIKIGKTLSENIGADLQIKVSANHLQKVGRELHVKGGQSVVLEAGLSITLKAGGSTIMLDPSGVSIAGSKVRINSGGGGGSAKAASPTAPKNPGNVDPGKPGDKLRLGRSNAINTIEKIPFGTGAAGKVMLSKNAPVSVAGSAANPVAKTSAADSVLASLAGGVAGEAGSRTSLSALSPSALPSTAKRVAGGIPDVLKSKAENVSSGLNNALQSTQSLQRQAESLTDAALSKANTLQQSAVHHAESLVSQGQQLIESTRQELLDQVKAGLAAVLPPQLQSMLDLLEENDFDFSE